MITDIKFLTTIQLTEYQTGSAVYVQGIAPSNRMYFYLLHDDEDKNNAPFLFATYIGKKLVLQSSTRNGRIEDRDLIKARPFIPGEKFNLAILRQDTRILVTVNGLHFSTYFNDVPLESAMKFLVVYPTEAHVEYISGAPKNSTSLII